jgi:hypothetical protein
MAACVAIFTGSAAGTFASDDPTATTTTTATAATGTSPPAALSAGDIRIEERGDGGFHLWVRADASTASVLLTDSSADPEQRLHSYALRTPAPNQVNSGEKRLLDGAPLPAGLNSIVDSTAEPHGDLRQAYHLFVPYEVEYGYSWTRHGAFAVGDGTYLNLRTFTHPYADYRGGYRDNPFLLRVVQQAVTVPTDLGAAAFADIAQNNHGHALASSGEGDLLIQLDTLLGGFDGNRLDLVLALDTTKSMENDMPFLRDQLVALVDEHAARFESVRVGVLLYRDYAESYLTRAIPFAQGTVALQTALDRVTVAGGRDLPEAVYEALDAGVVAYDWRADARHLVLVGDAPPHPRPRGTVTRESVFAAAKSIDLCVHTIIVEADEGFRT